MQNYQTTFRDNVSYKLTITTTGAKRTAVMGAQMPVFRITTTTPCWYKLGSSTVTATSTGNGSHFITAGIYYANKDRTAQYCSVIPSTASGTAVVTELTL